MICKLVLVWLIFITQSAFAQIDKDSLMNNLPLVDGKLIYSGTIAANGRGKVVLDSIAKKWFTSYFKNHQHYVAPEDTDESACVSERGVFEYHVRPRFYNISILYYAVATIIITCDDNKCSYNISDIYFRRANNVLNAIGFNQTPEYFISLYKQKHLGFNMSTILDKTMIKDYLYRMDLAITTSIASLNKALANQ